MPVSTVTDNRLEEVDMPNSYPASTATATQGPSRDTQPRNEQLRALLAIHGDIDTHIDDIGIDSVRDDGLLDDGEWAADQRDVA
jgi:hypothetical protein